MKNDNSKQIKHMVLVGILLTWCMFNIIMYCRYDKCAMENEMGMDENRRTQREIEEMVDQKKRIESEANTARMMIEIAKERNAATCKSLGR